jgi:thymidylate synthase (FAD)
MGARKINVLDKGYVLHKPEWFLGSGDLEVVNDARTSFDRESPAFSSDDDRLLQYLGDHGHTAPFRGSVIKFECYAPLMVARQWWRYIIGSQHDEGKQQDAFTAWNENSRRYISDKIEFYIPDEWRSAPDSKKQGSGEPLPTEVSERITRRLIDNIEQCLARYDATIEDGACVEQARLFLPAYGLYVRWRWTASLQSVAHFLNERLAQNAQGEMQEYAKAVYWLTKPLWEQALPQLFKGCEPDPRQVDWVEELEGC